MDGMMNEWRRARQEKLLFEEAADPKPGLWWLSYVDPQIAATIPEGQHRPGGSSFRGVVIVESVGPVSAGVKSIQLGIGYGWEAKIWGPMPKGTWCEEYHNRLLTHEQAHAAEGLASRG